VLVATGPKKHWGLSQPIKDQSPPPVEMPVESCSSHGKYRREEMPVQHRGARIIYTPSGASNPCLPYLAA
jgi:hypothetical protein